MTTNCCTVFLDRCTMCLAIYTPIYKGKFVKKKKKGGGESSREFSSQSITLITFYLDCLLFAHTAAGCLSLISVYNNKYLGWLIKQHNSVK